MFIYADVYLIYFITRCISKGGWSLQRWWIFAAYQRMQSAV